MMILKITLSQASSIGTRTLSITIFMSFGGEDLTILIRLYNKPTALI